MKFINFHFCSLSLPFDWKTPFGYLFAFVISSNACYAYIFSLCPMIYFLIGSCWLFVEAAEDITEDLSLLQKNDARLKRQLCDIIRFHAEAKQLSAEEDNQLR